jgi:hypothetical protein
VSIAAEQCQTPKFHLFYARYFERRAKILYSPAGRRVNMSKEKRDRMAGAREVENCFHFLATKIDLWGEEKKAILLRAFLHKKLFIDIYATCSTDACSRLPKHVGVC